MHYNTSAEWQVLILSMQFIPAKRPVWSRPGFGQSWDRIENVMFYLLNFTLCKTNGSRSKREKNVEKFTRIFTSENELVLNTFLNT